MERHPICIRRRQGRYLSRYSSTSTDLDEIIPYDEYVARNYHRRCPILVNDLFSPSDIDSSRNMNLPVYRDDDEESDESTSATDDDQYDRMHYIKKANVGHLLPPDDDQSDDNVSTAGDSHQRSYNATVYNAYDNQLYFEVCHQNTPATQRRRPQVYTNKNYDSDKQSETSAEFINDEYETSQDESIPSCAHSLNRRLLRKVAERNYHLFKPITQTSGIISPMLTPEFQTDGDLAVFRSRNDYAEAFNYYRKTSVDEGYMEGETNTTESEPSVQNSTFETTLINRNVKFNLPEKRSPKNSVASAIINQTRRLKRTSIVRFLTAATDSEEDDLEETRTDWQFVQVPEAPRPPIIIPDNQLSAWTPARLCKVSVRAGKVRHMIEYFNKIHDRSERDDVSDEVLEHPCARPAEIRMCPGSYMDARKQIRKFLLEARLPEKKPKKTFWKQVKDVVLFRKK